MRTRIIGLLLALLCLPLLTIALPTQAAPSAKMWDVVQAGDWDVVVRSIERQSGVFPALDEGMARTAVLVVDLTNQTNSPRQIDPSAFSLSTATGIRFVNLSATSAAQMYAVGRELSPSTSLAPPGQTVSTALLFVIPFDAGRFTLRFAPARTAIEIDECHCNLPSPVRTVGS